jgi:hypothetical protein
MVHIKLFKTCRRRDIPRGAFDRMSSLPTYSVSLDKFQGNTMPFVILEFVIFVSQYWHKFQFVIRANGTHPKCSDVIIKDRCAPETGVTR